MGDMGDDIFFDEDGADVGEDQAGGAIEISEESVAMGSEAADMKTCTHCVKCQPISGFAKKYNKKYDKWFTSGQCLKCENAVESFQKRMRLLWKLEYKAKMRECKANKDQYNKIISDEVTLNETRPAGTKRVDADAFQMSNEESAGTTVTDRVPEEPMTLVEWIKYAGSDEGGGKDAEEAKQMFFDREKEQHSAQR